ncbi:MAG: DUF4167 domain-containing protein [Methylocella sp.]
MRPGQQNKRGRNRHRGGGGGGGGGANNSGGNPLSRVYESNGPDVKVRGTAQTVAEKYLQLGRDAQSGGDIVMAESYYQYAEHYLRIVAAAQAYQQQLQPQYRRPEDGEEPGEEMPEGSESRNPQQMAEQPDMAGSQPFEPDRQQQHYRPQRDYRDRDHQQGNYGNRDRHRPRWQDRRGESQYANGETRAPAPQPRGDEQPRDVPPREEAANEPGQWEAPSFLRRPAPAAAAEDMAADTSPRKPRGERKPRREDSSAENTEPGPSEPSTVE